MKRITKIRVDNLTEKSVSILTQTFCVDGAEHRIENNFRMGYINSSEGRDKLESDVADPHYTEIMNVWGTSPTVEDLIIIIEDNYDEDSSSDGNEGSTGASASNDIIAHDVSVLTINGTSVSQTSSDTITIGG